MLVTRLFIITFGANLCLFSVVELSFFVGKPTDSPLINARFQRQRRKITSQGAEPSPVGRRIRAMPFLLLACAAIFDFGLGFWHACRWTRLKRHPHLRRVHWLLPLYRGRSAELLQETLCLSESSPLAWYHLLPFICGTVTGFPAKVDLSQAGDQIGRAHV